jgi:hypothetical protein
VSSALKINGVFTIISVSLAAVVCIYSIVLLVRHFSIEPRAESVYPYWLNSNKGT